MQSKYEEHVIIDSRSIDSFVHFDIIIELFILDGKFGSLRCN